MYYTPDSDDDQDDERVQLLDEDISPLIKDNTLNNQDEKDISKEGSTYTSVKCLQSSSNLMDFYHKLEEIEN